MGFKMNLSPLYGDKVLRCRFRPLRVKCALTPFSVRQIFFAAGAVRDLHHRPVDPDTAHPALGIDHGEARIGIAATDPLGILAHPVETIDVRKADAIERIVALAAARSIRTLVLGLPVRVDGTEGTAAEKVRRFGAKLAKRLPDLPLVYVDEAYTTMDAAAKLREAGRNAKQQKSVIDQAAAVAILELWMESA